MKLKRLFDSLPNSDEKYDAIIVILSSEPRSINILKKYNVDAPVKLAINCETKDSPAYSDNKDYLFNFGFAELAISDIARALVDLHENYSRKDVKVLVDITCASRPAMAEIFFAVKKIIEFDTVDLCICYSLALFTKPQLATIPNEAIEPVHSGFAGWPSKQSDPTSLITGLGYEPDKAEGASEFLDPAEQWGFIPTSPIEEYLAELETNNLTLISRLSQQNRLVRYDLQCPSRTFGQLELVIADLLRRSNPILLPFGPKIFFALCLIQSMRHPEVGVWHVTSETQLQTTEYCASGLEIGFTATFANDDSGLDEFTDKP